MFDVMTMADFLLARIAEDEAAAQAALRVLRVADRSTPARYLAECEARRRIVELHSARDAGDENRQWQWLICRSCGLGDEYEQRWSGVDYPCDTLKALALPYADHPDYRDEWRP